MNKIPLIVNLNSGTAVDKYDEIIAELGSCESYEIKDVSAFDEAFTKIMAAKQKPQIIILAGGDGTIIKSMEALIKAGYKGKFGLLPFGTANYLARNLNIPLDSSDALKVALHSKNAKKVPLAKANEELFALMMTIGLTQRVSSKVDDRLKQRIGQLAYVFETIRQAKNHKAFKYVITTPELKKPIKGTTHQLLVYNSDLNPQFKLVPDHSVTHPTVKVVASRSGNSVIKLSLSFLLHIISFGRNKSLLKSYQFKELTITTTPNKNAGIDGEVAGKGPFKVTAAATDVEIITP